jgi:hypothetical protein
VHASVITQGHTKSPHTSDGWQAEDKTRALVHAAAVKQMQMDASSMMVSWH